VTDSIVKEAIQGDPKNVTKNTSSDSRTEEGTGLSTPPETQTDTGGRLSWFLTPHTRDGLSNWGRNSAGEVKFNNDVSWGVGGLF